MIAVGTAWLWTHNHTPDLGAVMIGLVLVGYLLWDLYHRKDRSGLIEAWRLIMGISSPDRRTSEEKIKDLQEELDSNEKTWYNNKGTEERKSK